jgi:hypothetical protein
MTRFAGALVALLGLFATSASAASSRDFEVPSCPDPDLKGRDIRGIPRQTYNQELFEVLEEDSEKALALRTGQLKPGSVILKAPVHTCRIKQHPGLREWITSLALDGGAYDGIVDVQPFSQPPNVNFLAADGSLIERT